MLVLQIAIAVAIGVALAPWLREHVTVRLIAGLAAELVALTWTLARCVLVLVLVERHEWAWALAALMGTGMVGFAACLAVALLWLRPRLGCALRNAYPYAPGNDPAVRCRGAWV